MTFPFTMDPHDVPAMWWEADCVRYGLVDAFAGRNNEE